MQYLLTEDEYKALVPRAEVVELDVSLEHARVAILAAAKAPCIHDPVATGGRRGGYCDDCPVVVLTGGIAARHYRRICTRDKSFSQ